MAERDLPAIAGEQHERQRADRREEELAGEIELKNRGAEREQQQHSERRAERVALEPCADERQVFAVVYAEVAARARGPRHGPAPRACRTGPTAATPARESARGTAPRRRAAGRRAGSARLPPRR